MTSKEKRRPDLKPGPMLLHESVYVGGDGGKAKHVAGFVSTTLLERYQRFEACPALVLENSREGVRTLIERIGSYVPLEQVSVLLKHTGHSHRALVEYLQELAISVSLIPVQERPAGLLKTKKRDALSLANPLLNQLEKGIQMAGESDWEDRRKG